MRLAAVSFYVLVSELVPANAMRLPLLQASWAESSTLIFPNRHRLQMPWVDASSHATQMICLHAGRNRAAPTFVSKPVSANDLLSGDPERPVAIRNLGSDPHPTIARAVDYHLSPEALLQRTPSQGLRVRAGLHAFAFAAFCAV